MILRVAKNADLAEEGAAMVGPPTVEAANSLKNRKAACLVCNKL